MTEEVSKELFAKAEMALDCGQVMDGVDPRDILRLRPPTGSYASFEDWFHELEGFSLRSERAEGDIAWLRAAFDARRSPTEARGEPVAVINAQGGVLLTREGEEWFKSLRLSTAPVGSPAAYLYASHPPAREAVDEAMERDRAIIHELAADIRDRMSNEEGSSVWRDAQRIVELSRPKPTDSALAALQVKP